MSLCHKPFVYKGWASDIKWHYRPKSDIKLQSTPFFSVFLAIMLFTPYIFFTLIEFYQTYRLTFLNSISSLKKHYIQIINMIVSIWKCGNNFRSWMYKCLPKFQSLLSNRITSANIQFYYISIYVIKLHQHIYNQITPIWM